MLHKLIFLCTLALFAWTGLSEFFPGDSGSRMRSRKGSGSGDGGNDRGSGSRRGSKGSKRSRSRSGKGSHSGGGSSGPGSDSGDDRGTGGVAFAFAGSEDSLCFTDIESLTTTQWGWALKIPHVDSEISGKIYKGATGCDLENAKKHGFRNSWGSFIVNRAGCDINVNLFMNEKTVTTHVDIQIGPGPYALTTDNHEKTVDHEYYSDRFVGHVANLHFSEHFFQRCDAKWIIIHVDAFADGDDSSDSDSATLAPTPAPKKCGMGWSRIRDEHLITSQCFSEIAGLDTDANGWTTSFKLDLDSSQREYTFIMDLWDRAMGCDINDPMASKVGSVTILYKHRQNRRQIAELQISLVLDDGWTFAPTGDGMPPQIHFFESDGDPTPRDPTGDLSVNTVDFPWYGNDDNGDNSWEVTIDNGALDCQLVGFEFTCHVIVVANVCQEEGE